MRTVIVMYNINDPSNAIAFPDWDTARSYIALRTLNNPTWKDAAEIVYRENICHIYDDDNAEISMREFTLWVVDEMRISDINELVEALGYEPLEEIDFVSL